MTELHWSEVVRRSTIAATTRPAEPEHRATDPVAGLGMNHGANTPPGPEVEPVSTFLVALAEGAQGR